MKLGRIALVTGALLASAYAGCSSNDGIHHGTGSESTDVGEVAMQLRLPSGVDINSVSYTITRNGSTVRQGDVPLNNSTLIKYQVGNLPAGTGYSISMTANGAACSAAAVSFQVLAGQTSSVLLTLRCGGGTSTVTTDAGNVLVNVDVVDDPSQVCGEVDGLGASPLETAVGTSVSLQGYTTAPAALTWSVAPTAGGTFTPATGAAVSFACVQPGTHRVTFSVKSTGSRCVASTAFVDVTCTGDAIPSDAGPDAEPVNDAGPDAAPVNDAGPDAEPVNDAGPDAEPVNDAGPDAEPVNDAGPDAAPVNDAGDAGPVNDGGPGPNPDQVACTNCRNTNCTAFNGIDFVSGCFVRADEANGADPTDPLFIQQCVDVVTCTQNNNGCSRNPALAGSVCYCGNKELDACNTGGPATDGTATCVPQWQAAARATANPDVQAAFSNFALPAGWAFFLLDCELQFCADTCLKPTGGVVP